MARTTVWLPLSGRLLSTGGHEHGDPLNPVTIVNPVIDWKVELETTTTHPLDFDWEAKQVQVEVEGSEALVSWLGTEHGLKDGMDKLPDKARTAILAKLGKPALEQVR